jgi:hypothetical protein
MRIFISKQLIRRWCYQLVHLDQVDLFSCTTGMRSGKSVKPLFANLCGPPRLVRFMCCSQLFHRRVAAQQSRNQIFFSALLCVSQRALR